MVLRDKLKDHENLISNSLEAVKRLKEVRAGEKRVLVKVDIKDLYVISLDYKIVEQVTSLFVDKGLKDLVFKVAFFLLSNQFVKSGKQLRRVRQGCGIGLLHAGDLADACWYAMVERPLHNTGEFVAAGINEWFRFRDDMLFLCGSVIGFRNLLAKMEKYADWWQLKVEDASTIQIRFLDLVVRNEVDGIMCEPHLKDPNLSRRLAASSAHPASVHRSWPRAVVSNIDKITDGDVALAYKREIMSRLGKDGCVVPGVQPGQPDFIRVETRLPENSFVCWLPLGFHPFWQRQVKKVVRRVNKDTSLQSLFLNAMPGSECVNIKVAWRNFLPSVQNLIQR